MKGIIMAGGAGSRLRPLTCDRPKPLVPVGNKPVMEYAIDLLNLYGIKDIGVTLQYLPEKISDYFQNGEPWNVNLKYFVEKTPLGTAGSVKNAEEFLDESFIVISGDALTDFNLAKAIDFHKKRQAIATLVLTTVENPLEYGLVITDEQGKIVKFLEKPSWGEVFSDQVNTGIYILEPEVLSLIPAEKPFDFSRDLFPELLRRGAPLYGIPLEGYWCDIGNLEQYVEAHHSLLRNEIKTTPKGIYQGEGIWLGKDVRIDGRASLKGPLLIGDHCRIEAGAELGPYTVLGNNIRVKENASIKKSILWDGAYIGEGAELRGTVICNKVGLEKGVSVFEGAVIGEQTIIEKNSMIKPEVKIWPYKRVGQGTVLYESLIWGKKKKKNLFKSLGISGPLNREITPEEAVRIGAAYGSMLGLNKKIGVAADGQKGVSMLKNAFISGVLSTGVHVNDLGVIPFTALRHGVEVLGLAGGVYLITDGNDPKKIWLRFVGQNGYLFSSSNKRQLETIYFREDFRRVSIEELGLNHPLTNLEEIYSDYLLKQVNWEEIKNREFSIVIGTSLNPLNNFFPRLLKRIGVDVLGVIGEVPQDRIPMTDIPANITFLAEEVISQQRDLGVLIDAQGEKLFLIDDQGKIIDENLYLLLVALIILKTNPKAKIAVPVTAPQAVEAMAEKFGGEIIRTKTELAQLMEIVKEREFFSQQGYYSQQAMQFDGSLAILKILDYLATNNISLSSLLKEIPNYYMEIQSIPCPRELGGKLIRKFAEEKGEEKIELKDGLKIFKEDGWVLMLPDADEPLYRIYSESYSQEAAEELASFYVEKIQEFVFGNSST